MAHRRSALTWAAASVLVIACALSACVPEPGETPTAGASSTTGPSSTGPREPSASPTSASAAMPIPTDCRGILSAAVLEELGDTPLNSPTVPVSGAQPDGSLICVWGDPATDVAHLSTTIMYASRGPALDMLNGLLAEGYACYTPDGGTRCEKTWFSEPDLVPKGRTLFWRQDVLIDTTFSSLAPSGYTSAIVASVFG